MIEKRISFKLDPGDIFIYDNALLKTASVNLPDNIPYDPNFLYVEVRAVSAGEYYGNNKNIDYFPEVELNPPKKNAGYGKETFMTAHVFKNHDNKDVANAIGDVLKVKWDDEMKGVNLLLRIDKKTSPSVARGFEAGYITDVSMGCRVHHVVCSICGHNARTKADYCNHLKTEKGKIYPDGKKVQEINIQPKFHDISVVLNGAEKIAKVMKIYRDDSQRREKTASLTSDDMTRIALDLGMSKHASVDELGGMLKLAGAEDGITADTLASHDTVRSFISEYIEAANRENLEKIALEQEFDKLDPKKQAFGKLATIQKLSEFEKRIEGEIIRSSAKAVEEKMQAEVDSDDAFTDALNVAKMRSFKELGDEECDEIAKKLLALSEEKRIPRFEILRTFFTVLATKGIHLTLTEFSHLTLHVLKGMAFEGDHDVFERKINDYRARLTEMIMADIRRQEIMPGTGLFNVQNAIAAQQSPLGANGLDKMIMALSGSAPFGVRAVVRRPMMKIASYQEGACSPAGIMGSDMTNEVIFTLETMVDECLPLVDRNRPIMSYAADLMEIAEMEKTAGIFDRFKKKKFSNQIRKTSNPIYEKIEALPPDLRVKYSKDSTKFNHDRWDYVYKNVKDSDFDQEGNLSDDKYFPLVDGFNKKYGELTPMGYVYKKKANEDIAEMEKWAAREDFVPTKNYGWTQKMPRSYSQWEKFRPKTREEWGAWEDWQNSADHGDGDDWDKERWKEQKHFAETGETASAWIARSAKERQAEAEQRTMKQQQRAATRKKWMKPIAGAALGAGLGLTNLAYKGLKKTAALENYYDETGNAGGEFGWKVRGTETKKEQEKRLKAEAAYDAWVKTHQASKKYHALSAGLVASGLYKGHKKQNLASLGLLSGGLAVGAAAGIGNRNAYNKYQRAQAEQEKTAESMPARYKKIDWDNDPTGEKKKIKRKLLASGALTAAGLGVNLSQLALATRDIVKNTNHAKLGVNLAGTVGGRAGLLLSEKQLQKAEKLEGLPVGGTPNQKKSRLDDWNLIIY